MRPPRTSRTRLVPLLLLPLFLPLGSCGDERGGTAPAAGPVSVVVVSGDAQSAPVGSELAAPVVAKVTSPRGTPVPNQLVNFRVVTGGGSVYAGSSMTNAHGIAQEWWTLGTIAGANQLEVRAVDPTSGEKLSFATFTATAVAGPLAKIAVTPPSATLLPGGTTQLVAALEDQYGNAVSGEAVTWRSADPAVADVSSTGLVTGVAAGGPVAVTATAGGKSGSAQITVARPPVARVVVMPTQLVVTVGDVAQLHATPQDAAGNALADRAVFWQSTRSDIVEVRQDGSIIARAPGHANISATSEGMSGFASVDVHLPPVASITITPASLTLDVGQSGQLTAVLRDASGNAIAGRNVDWRSSDPSAVTIGGNGQTATVTAISGGTSATITATVDGQTASATVSVRAQVLAPDPYEPNDIASQASELGNLPDGSVGVITAATIHSTTDEDWYHVRAVEASGAACFPGTSQSFVFQVDLLNIPAGRDYDLEVRLGAPNSTPRASLNGGSSNERVVWTTSGVCGNADSFDFWVRVNRFEGTPTTQPYRLELRFDRN